MTKWLVVSMLAMIAQLALCEEPIPRPFSPAFGQLGEVDGTVDLSWNRVDENQLRIAGGIQYVGLLNTYRIGVRSNGRVIGLVGEGNVLLALPMAIGILSIAGSNSSAAGWVLLPIILTSSFINLDLGYGIHIEEQEVRHGLTLSGDLIFPIDFIVEQWSAKIGFFTTLYSQKPDGALRISLGYRIRDY